MRSLISCAALLVLAACGSQEPAEPAPTATLAALAPVEPTMPPPDEETFASAYAEACPGNKPVGTSLCKSQGLGKEGFICDYGLGDDEYRRKSATVVPVDGKWTLAEPEKICAADAA